MSSEAARVAWLRETLGSALGDDAALLEPPRTGTLVWTVDAQVEGVHFRREWLTLEEVGWRSFMAAASDLAAMGAIPSAALSALALPGSLDDRAFHELVAGQRAAAAHVGAPIVGGNLVRASELSVTTTLLGRSEHPVRRDGGVAGDTLYLAGAVGRARLGLEWLQRGISGPRVDEVVGSWRRPTALVPSGITMAKVAHAAIDVSDGLAQDASRLGHASGQKVVLDVEALLASADEAYESTCRLLGLDPLTLMLEGGEDYALLVASAAPIAGFLAVGWLEEGEGLALAEAGGQRAWVPRGFDHFG